MRTQCCQPAYGSVQCNNCPFTTPDYRMPPVEPTIPIRATSGAYDTNQPIHCPCCGQIIRGKS